MFTFSWLKALVLGGVLAVGSLAYTPTADAQFGIRFYGGAYARPYSGAYARPYYGGRAYYGRPYYGGRSYYSPYRSYSYRPYSYYRPYSRYSYRPYSYYYHRPYSSRYYW